MDEFHPIYPLVLFFKGQYHYYKNEWKTAEHLIHNAINCCTQNHINPSPNFLSYCYDVLGTSRYYQNDLEKALYYVQEGLNQLDETIPYKKIKYMLLGNKVIYLEKLGENTQALQLAQKIKTAMSEIQTLHVKLNLNKSIANLLLKSNQFDEAIRVAQEGFDIAQSSPRNRFTFDFLMILGTIYLLQRDFETATEYLQTVISLDPNMEFPRRHVDAYTNLAILYNCQKNWSSAKEYLLKAIHIGRKANDIYRLTKSLIVYGNYHLLQNQIKEATPIFQEAWTLSKENQFKYRQYSSLFKLVECHAILGNSKEFSALNEELFYLQKKIHVKGEDEVYEIQ